MCCFYLYSNKCIIIVSYIVDLSYFTYILSLHKLLPERYIYTYVISFIYTPFYHTGANILSFEIDPPKITYMAAILWA